MSDENGEAGNNPEPVPVATTSNVASALQYYLDRSELYPLRRWLVTLGIVMIYALRVHSVKGFHVVSYGLATYVLNLLIGFLSPKVDPELEGLEGTSFPGKDCDEYRPFERRLPEFRFWYSITKASIVSLILTFLSVLDVPVFWPILLSYWIFLMVVTTCRHIVHVLKYKYNPFWKGGKLSRGLKCWLMRLLRGYLRRRRRNNAA